MNRTGTELSCRSSKKVIFNKIVMQKLVERLLRKRLLLKRKNSSANDLTLNLIGSLSVLRKGL